MSEEKKIHKVSIDKNACINCGSCSILAPDAFGLDENTNESLVKEGAEKLDDILLQSAAESCPTQAIILQDGQGNQIYPEKN